MHTFRVDGTAAPQGSKTAFNRGGRCVLVESSKKVKPWRQAVAKAARENIPEPMKGEVHLTVEFALPRTKAMGNKPAPPMIQRPDVDKLLRSTFDGLSGAAYEDDSQVTRVTASKRRTRPGEQPHARIALWQPTSR